MRLLGVPHEVVELDYRKAVKRQDTPGLARFLAANPLGQFPTMITPEGIVITEMVVIVLCESLSKSFLVLFLDSSIRSKRYTWCRVTMGYRQPPS